MLRLIKVKKSKKRFHNLNYLLLLCDVVTKSKLKMETENIQEIEVWKIEINDDDIVTVNYSIYENSQTTKSEAFVTQPIAFKTLLKHCKEAGLNHVYLYSPDELTELDADIFTRDNLYVVVKDYLTENLK